MKVNLLILSLFLLLGISSNGQTCVQPGGLMSVKNLSGEKYDYLVFKFLKPRNDKGNLSGAKADLFPASLRSKSSFHKIVFNNVAFFCYNKVQVIAPTKRILDFKVEQKADNMVSYVFALAEGAKISSHYVYKQHSFYIVKIRIE